MTNVEFSIHHSPLKIDHRIFNIQKTIRSMAKKEKHLNAKQKAYAAKEEQKGKNVVNWIFGVLILLGVLYLVYSIYAG